MRRRRCVALGVVATLAATLATSAAAYTPEPVIATAAVELQPAAAPGYLAYSRSSLARPNRFNLLVQPDGASRFRINPRGTIAFAGSIDGTTLAYAQRRTSGGLGNIKFFDLVAGTRSTPGGVNTDRHEGQPHLSGEWLMFLRSRRPTSARRILLRNLLTGEQRELDFGDTAFVQAGGLAGNYATWTRCPRANRCRTWFYDIAAGTKSRLPNPLDKSQFAASVTADGTAYYAESRTILCSARKVVRFWRQPLVGDRELLGRLPRGKDTAVTSPVVLAGGAVDLFFDRFNATCARSDIFKVPVPAPGP